MKVEEKERGQAAPLGRRLVGVLAGVCVLNVVGHLLVQPYLPAELPIHWNSQGIVDGWMPKAADPLMAGVPIATLVLLAVVPRIDPRGGAYGRVKGFYRGFAAWIVAFLCAVTWSGPLTVFGIIAEGRAMAGIAYVAVGALLVYAGNYLPRVPQNYTMGVKTPWTIDDPEVWRRTQRLGGRLLVACGAVAILLGAGETFGPAAVGEIAPAALVVSVIALVGTLYVYSWALWKRRNG